MELERLTDDYDDYGSNDDSSIDLENISLVDSECNNNDSDENDNNSQQQQQQRHHSFTFNGLEMEPLSTASSIVAVSLTQQQRRQQQQQQQRQQNPIVLPQLQRPPHSSGSCSTTTTTTSSIAPIRTTSGSVLYLRNAAATAVQSNHNNNNSSSGNVSIADNMSTSSTRSRSNSNTGSHNSPIRHHHHRSRLLLSSSSSSSPSLLQQQSMTAVPSLLSIQQQQQQQIPPPPPPPPQLLVPRYRSGDNLLYQQWTRTKSFVINQLRRTRSSSASITGSSRDTCPPSGGSTGILLQQLNVIPPVRTKSGTIITTNGKTIIKPTSFVFVSSRMNMICCVLVCMMLLCLSMMYYERISFDVYMNNNSYNDNSSKIKTIYNSQPSSSSLLLLPPSISPTITARRSTPTESPLIEFDEDHEYDHEIETDTDDTITAAATTTTIEQNSHPKNNKQQQQQQDYNPIDSMIKLQFNVPSTSFDPLSMVSTTVQQSLSVAEAYQQIQQQQQKTDEVGDTTIQSTDNKNSFVTWLDYTPKPMSDENLKKYSKKVSSGQEFVKKWCDVTGTTWYPTDRQVPINSDRTSKAIATRSSSSTLWQLRAPYFLLPGAAYSGTVYMSAMLHTHPQIIKARTKQLQFFYDQPFHKYISLKTQKTLVSNARHRMYARDYNIPALQSNTSLVSFDATPGYLYHSTTIPLRILCVEPWIKLVVVLRNPIDRILEQYYAQYVNINNNNNKGSKRVNNRIKKPIHPLEEYLQHEIDLMKHVGLLNRTSTSSLSVSNTNWTKLEDMAWYEYQTLSNTNGLIGRSMYVIQLRHWINAYRMAGRIPSQSIIVIQTEKFIYQPQYVMNQLLQFMNLTSISLLQPKPPMSLTHQTRYIRNDTRQILEDFFLPYNQQLKRLLYKYSIPIL